MDTISVYNPITNLTCVHKVSKFWISDQGKKELSSHMHYKTAPKDKLLAEIEFRENRLNMLKLKIINKHSFWQLI